MRLNIARELPDEEEEDYDSGDDVQEVEHWDCQIRSRNFSPQNYLQPNIAIFDS